MIVPPHEAQAKGVRDFHRSIGAKIESGAAVPSSSNVAGHDTSPDAGVTRGLGQGASAVAVHQIGWQDEELKGLDRKAIGAPATRFRICKT